MKQSLKKIINLILVFLIGGFLIGCKFNKNELGGFENPIINQGREEAMKEESEHVLPTYIDTSKPVNLVFYLIGDEPKDMAIVQEKINEVMIDKINTTITFKFTTWTDWQTKYNIILSSGEDCDLIYTANWINYSTLASNGAFAELDELLPRYAPELYADISEQLWTQMKVNGTIYSVPSSKSEYTNGGIMYREDLREAYNLPVPDSLENIEAYLEGIKANNPTQSLMRPSVHKAYLSYSFSAFLVFQVKYGWVQGGAPYGLAAYYNNPSELVNYWASDNFREDMKIMKRWADKGFWSMSALSDSNDANAFKNELEVLVIDGQNPSKYTSDLIQIGNIHPDWKLGYVPYAKMNGVAYVNHATGNGTAISRNSLQKERAVMALNLLYTDGYLNRLIQYGIEGIHYVIDNKGFYQSGKSNSRYGKEAANTWNLRNPQYALSSENDMLLEEISEELKEIAKQTRFPDVDIASGFVEVYDSYTEKRARLAAVMTEYLAPIQAGLVEDVDKAIDEFLQKAEEAGLSTIQEAYIEQWKAYCEEYGYK